jgi:hypothetical protein
LEPAAAGSRRVDAGEVGRVNAGEVKRTVDNVLNNILSVMDGQIFILSTGVFSHKD